MTDLTTWRSEYNSLITRESALTSEIRRTLGNLKELLGPNSFNEAIGKGIQIGSQDVTGEKGRVQGGLSAIRKAVNQVKSAPNSRPISKKSHTRPQTGDVDQEDIAEPAIDNEQPLSDTVPRDDDKASRPETSQAINMIQSFKKNMKDQFESLKAEEAKISDWLAMENWSDVFDTWLVNQQQHNAQGADQVEDDNEDAQQHNEDNDEPNHPTTTRANRPPTAPSKRDYSQVPSSGYGVMKASHEAPANMRHEPSPQTAEELVEAANKAIAAFRADNFLDEMHYPLRSDEKLVSSENEENQDDDEVANQIIRECHHEVEDGEYDETPYRPGTSSRNPSSQSHRLQGRQPSAHQTLTEPLKPTTIAAEVVERRIRDALEALAVETERDGGSTGGWSQEEHSMFLRCISRGTAVEAALPLLTHEAVRQHREWFQRYQSRVQLKKRLLKDWRVNREALLNRQHQLNEIFNIDFQAEKEKQLMDRQRHQARQLELKMQIEEWRVTKSIDQQRQQEEHNLKLEEMRLKQAIEQEERLKLKRDVILKLKDEKAKIAHELKLAQLELYKKDKLERMKLLEANKQRLSERISTNANKRKELQHQKQLAHQQRQIAQELLVKGKREEINSKVSSKFNEACDKKPGQAELEREQVERYLDRFGKRRAESFGGVLNHVPTRAVPTWRQNAIN